MRSHDRFGTKSVLLTNRVTKETLTLDWNAPHEIINLYAFREHLTELRDPGPAERRLLRFFPGGKGIKVAFYYLADLGVLRELESDDGSGALEFRLHRQLDRYQEAVQAFLAAWNDSSQLLQLASMIGDYEVIKALVNAETQDRLLEQAIERTGNLDRKWLGIVRVAAWGELSEDVLYALKHCKADDLPCFIREALTTPAAAEAAIEIIMDDGAWLAEVSEVFRKGVDDRGFAGARGIAAKYLAKHGHPVDDLLNGLLAPPSDLYSSMHLAVDHAPHRLGRLLLAGLRSPECYERMTAAAVLALMDNASSRQAISSFLATCKNPESAAECRRALLESRDPEAHRIVDRWEDDLGENAVIIDADVGWLHEKMEDFGHRTEMLRQLSLA